MNNHFSASFFYFITILLAMCLKIMPLPPVFEVWNPDWVLLILIYWVLVLPYKFGVFGSWVVGLLTDVLTGRTLGQYALVYAILSYVCLKFHKRVRTFPILQQGVFVFCCLLAAQILVFGVESFNNPSRLHLSFLLPVLSGTFIWPIASVILRFIRLNHRVR